MPDRPDTAGLPSMSAVPRWSHRDPVEGGNPFPAGELRHARWEEATARALADLKRYDDGLAGSELAGGEPTIYARRWLDLAAMRFDTWARRSLAAVDNAAARRDYAAWLQTYVTNWQVYVADTCPHVPPNIHRELGTRLATRATHWINEATRQPRTKHAPPDTTAGVDGR